MSDVVDCDVLIAALKQKAGVTVVSATSTESQVRLILRVPAAGMGTWIQVVEQMLTYAQSAPWTADISKQYFIKGAKLLYGWRLIVQGGNIEQHILSVAQLVNSTSMRARQLEEVTLYGNTDYSVLKHGKGAQGVLTATIGGRSRG